MNKNYVIGLTCREADRDPLSTSLALDDGLLGVLSSKDYACVILPNLDYETQLIAIRHLLVTHEKMVKAMDEKTEEFQRVIKKYKGSRYEFAVDELSEKIGFSIYQSAAQSMSAVGMLAPFCESIFHQAFYGIYQEFYSETEKLKLERHFRWKKSVADKWDCHYVWDKNGRRKDLMRGILQLADATGLKHFLPSDIELVLKALFGYRNKMFHYGFEWPVEERTRFWERQQSEDWPVNWFSRATISGETWIIYLTKDFIDHCINTIGHIIETLENFVVNKSGIAQQSAAGDGKQRSGF